MSSYRCREHIDHAVTFKGTGCRACAHAQREPKERDADTAEELLDVFGVPIRQRHP